MSIIAHTVNASLTDKSDAELAEVRAVVFDSETHPFVSVNVGPYVSLFLDARSARRLADVVAEAVRETERQATDTALFEAIGFVDVDKL